MLLRESVVREKNLVVSLHISVLFLLETKYIWTNCGIFPTWVPVDWSQNPRSMQYIEWAILLILLWTLMPMNEPYCTWRQNWAIAPNPAISTSEVVLKSFHFSRHISIGGAVSSFSIWVNTLLPDLLDFAELIQWLSYTFFIAFHSKKLLIIIIDTSLYS